jgi:DNA polymerase-1
VEKLVARTTRDLDLAFERLSTAAAVGCDTETSGLSAKYGKLFSVQFSDGKLCVLVPISECVQPGKLGDLLSDPSITKIFHNARFDLDFLHQAGHSVKNVFDTMIAEKVLTKGADQSASLAECLYRYFAVDLEKSHRTKFTRKWNGIWTDELVEYALADVAYLPLLMREQMEWLVRLGLNDEFKLQMQKTITIGDRQDVLP